MTAREKIEQEIVNLQAALVTYDSVRETTWRASLPVHEREAAEAEIREVRRLLKQAEQRLTTA